MAILNQEFSIDKIGEVSGETFKGVFKVKIRLTHRDLLLQDQMRRDLLGPKPESASPSAVSTSMVFAKIWTHLVDAPNWWKDAGNGIELVDEAPVVAVYDSIIKIESDAIEALKKQGDAAAEALRKTKE